MSVNNFYLKDVTLVNNFKQIGADELEQLRVESGDVKLLPSSKNYDWYSTKKKVGSNLCEGEVITLGRARYANVKYWKGSFVSSNNIIVSSKDESKLLTKFLYYFLVEKLLCFYTTTSTYPKFDKNIFNRTKITIPPLEKQKEIVDKLDKFATLEAELKAELEARGKQYNHYRDQLLNCTTSNIFKNVIESERTVLITDLFNYERGKRLIKANRIKGDIPFVTAGHLNDGITEYISNEEKYLKIV
ncbi:restriction endonuclease subunit S [Mycoplasmopsis caviae]|uniref:Restriction endonuclease subunit S n=1 Tax=Mycoplasmopsis caviae TaxID=55603 RepID=A0ABY5J0W9_9BACT|nr:restriction endonuclease subunit S [Mycoplasmopsis caviae]UUD35480.1 restriction endonuclease subunit S [Mycoplasmopsis caviae]